MRTTPQEWTMTASFVGTREQAEKLQEVLQASAAVFFNPTEENASALFTLGAEAVVSVGQRQHEEASTHRGDK